MADEIDNLDALDLARLPREAQRECRHILAQIEHRRAIVARAEGEIVRLREGLEDIVRARPTNLPRRGPNDDC